MDFITSWGKEKKKYDNFHMTLPPDSNLVWPPSSERSQLAHQATSLGCGKWSLCWTVECGDLSIVVSPFMCMCCSYLSYTVMWWFCVYILIHEVCSVLRVTIQSHSPASQHVKGVWEWGYIVTVTGSNQMVAVTLASFPGFHWLPCSFTTKTGAGEAREWGYNNFIMHFSCHTKCSQWRIQGGFIGFHGTPLL